MISTLRETIAAIKDALGQLDAHLISAEANGRTLDHLPAARGLVELATAREKLTKTADRLIELARMPPEEPKLFDESEVS